MSNLWWGKGSVGSGRLAGPWRRELEALEWGRQICEGRVWGRLVGLQGRDDPSGAGEYWGAKNRLTEGRAHPWGWGEGLGFPRPVAVLQTCADGHYTGINHSQSKLFHLLR